MDTKNRRPKRVNAMSSLESRWGKNRAKLNKLSIKLPPQKVRHQFVLMYEFQGCQKATDFLSKYYKVKKTKIHYKTKSLTKHSIAWYCQNKTYLTKEGLKKRVVLHEFYHHLIYCKDIELLLREEERQARQYSRDFLRVKGDS
ncbi:MAG TPA: hypothetical protein VLH35_01350 [Candidatus Acidoferrales bacterium]|nr:hypothetical protein [Candidatus Acidoferrales bacterium]